MDKPDKIRLKRCVICNREQTWNPSGYLETKGWHGVELHTGGGSAQSNFGNRLFLRYPVGNGDVVCTECIPKIVDKYTDAMSVWA